MILKLQARYQLFYHVMCANVRGGKTNWQNRSKQDPGEAGYSAPEIPKLTGISCPVEPDPSG